MYVYIVTNTINGKKYIGLSLNKKKWFRSWYYGSGKLIKKAIIKYGKENFNKEIVKEFENEDDCRNFERHLIRLYNAVEDPMYYNMSPGGYGGACLGHSVTEETRKKISLVNTGKKRSKESCDNIGNCKRGIKQSDEHIEKRKKLIKENWDNRSSDYRKSISDKIRISNIGKKRSNDIKEKISKSNSRLSKEDILNIFDMYENNNITYSEIGDIYKLNTSSVWAILNKVSYKWVWG